MSRSPLLIPFNGRWYLKRDVVRALSLVSDTPIHKDVPYEWLTNVLDHLVKGPPDKFATFIKDLEEASKP
jgi:hypothetical protein